MFGPKMTSHAEIDALIKDCLAALAADPHVRRWRAKEHNWVNYFVFKHLLSRCQTNGVISDPTQIGIEVQVAQPPDYQKGI